MIITHWSRYGVSAQGRDALFARVIITHWSQYGVSAQGLDALFERIARVFIAYMRKDVRKLAESDKPAPMIISSNKHLDSISDMIESSIALRLEMLKIQDGDRAAHKKKIK